MVGVGLDASSSSSSSQSLDLATYTLSIVPQSCRINQSINRCVIDQSDERQRDIPDQVGKQKRKRERKHRRRLALDCLGLA